MNSDIDVSMYRDEWLRCSSGLVKTIMYLRANGKGERCLQPKHSGYSKSASN